MQTFFCTISSESQALLNEEETRHLKVLRVKVADLIDCVDGAGGIYKCRVSEIRKDSTALEVIESTKIEGRDNFKLHLYVAPTKNAERMEWFLEKAVETGLDALTFIETEHSEKHRVNMQRMERIAISALKQSGQLYLPELNGLKSLKDIEPEGSVFFAHCGKGEKRSLKSLFEKTPPSGNIHVFIGPEGDFSNDEIMAFKSKDYVAITLGPSRLRTETAALYSVMVVNALS